MNNTDPIRYCFRENMCPRPGINRDRKAASSGLYFFGESLFISSRRTSNSGFEMAEILPSHEWVKSSAAESQRCSALWHCHPSSPNPSSESAYCPPMSRSWYLQKRYQSLHLPTLCVDNSSLLPSSLAALLSCNESHLVESPNNPGTRSCLGSTYSICKEPWVRRHQLDNNCTVNHIL